MDAIRILGGTPLKGTIPISGAKNAALALMPACLLTGDALTLTSLPHLADIRGMARLLSELGVTLHMDGLAPGGDTGRVLKLSGGNLKSTTAPYDLVRKMRASVLVLGPLVARHGIARVSLPGGCAIGTRPVDLHIMALRELGAEIELTGGYIEARAPRGLKGNKITFPLVSVGATENTLMAASLAKGETILENAAREPEITDLADCLNAMGARISGAGTSTITIQGVDALHAATHAVLPDRIEAGTYALAAAITGGDVRLTGARAEHLTALIQHMKHAGCIITPHDDGFSVALHERAKGVDVMTEPYPGFPTDLQAQFMALMTLSSGASMITETIFENRFMHAPELQRMGADITVHNASALVRGVAKLSGAAVMATDLRASSSLVLAGLAAHGETVVHRVYHLDRGYERLEQKLAACGAQIERIQVAN